MTNEKPLTLAYSPCPNDTYIFAALTNGMLENAPPVNARLEDIESLNLSALKGTHELTKVSYALIPFLMDNYKILRSGGALGRGCGPVVVAKPGAGKSLEDFRDKLIAIPGERTTAFLLLQLALGEKPQTIAMRFDKIPDAVTSGVADAGLIIHETRFTYKDEGLEEICDLGDWWEEETGLPIPLGAIVARNDLNDRAAEAEDAIRRSLQFARQNEDRVMKYVREHAVEMKEDVMRKHIELYVNEFSEDIGEEGQRAIDELFKRARNAGAIPQAEAGFA